jgi:hypothetical protein
MQNAATVPVQFIIRATEEHVAVASVVGVAGMTGNRAVAAVGRFLLFVALLNVATFAVIGPICWFGGWRTAGDFGNGLTYAGLVVMAIGGARYFGGLSSNTNPAIGYQSMNLREQHNWVVRTMSERDSAFVVMLKLGASGLGAMVLGQLLRAAVA